MMLVLGYHRLLHDAVGEGNNRLPEIDARVFGPAVFDCIQLALRQLLA